MSGRMEILAHGLWAAAAAVTARKTKVLPVRTGWLIWWAVFPDVLAFGPRIVAGLWLRLTGSAEAAGGHLLPHVHIGLPLYPFAHSLLVFLLVFALTAILARRIVFEMLGWLLHIAIDIPTHSLRYYATRFLWPLSEFRIDGIAWWTPWFWIATYAALAAVYLILWRKGWLARARSPWASSAERNRFLNGTDSRRGAGVRNWSVMRKVLAAFFLTGVLACAQIQVGRIEVLVAPDRPDWKYAPGEKVTFLIRAVRNGADVEGAKVAYSVGPELMPPAANRTGVLERGVLRVDGGTMQTPGFLRCTARVTEGNYTYQGLATAAFAPEKIQPVARDPEDFEAFWRSGKEELAKLPVDARRTLLPELSTAAVDVYHVSLHNVGRSRVFGMLALPKAPGKYPAILSVPGAGVHKIGPLIELAEKGAITLAIGIHGIPLTMDPGVYTALGAGALNGYWAYDLDSRDRYYYRRVYLGCVRANDYLASLPEWNGRDLAVTGGSQGGALSIVTAGLDPRVTALAASYPALSDMAGYTEGRAGGWPHVFRAAGPGSHRTPEKLATAAYYDVVNFARRVKAPGIYTWGFNDQTCPPTSMYASYNVIRAPKQLVLALETGHGRVPEQADALNGWLQEFIATGKPPVR